MMEKEQITKQYNKFLSKSKNIKIKDVIKVTSTNSIKKGELYYKGLFGGYFGVKVAENDREFKTTIYKIDILDEKISKNYLLWYLKQKEVQDYLSQFIKGSVIPFLPRKDFYELKIRLPSIRQQALLETSEIKETNIKFNSDFREILEILYKEYEINEKNNNLLSCAVLAGAIAEAILLSYLKDMGVKEKHLKQKMLGSIIEIAEIKEFDNFPYNSFKKIQKLRNNIHPERLKANFSKTFENQLKEDLKELDIIVKHFGI